MSHYSLEYGNASQLVWGTRTRHVTLDVTLDVTLCDLDMTHRNLLLRSVFSGLKNLRGYRAICSS